MAPTTALAIGFAAAVVFSAFALEGCAAPADEATPMKVAKSCLRSACDERMASDGQACSRCTSACFDAMQYYDCDPSDACSASCSPSSECSDSERTQCVQQGFKADLPSATSDALAAACNRMFDRYAECGVRTSVGRASCITWAKTERPERAKDYDCLAALPCDADESACAVPPNDFGDRFCDAMGAVCEGFCSDEVRDALNQQGPWLKDDVVAAGLSCAQQSTCGEAKQCVDAWATAASL